MNSSAAHLAIATASFRIRTSGFAKWSVMRRRPRPRRFPFPDRNSQLSRDNSGSVRHVGAATLVDFFFAWAAPRAAILFKQFFGFDGPPGAGRVIGESARW